MTDPNRTAERCGAVEMARYWVRHPGDIGETPYPQLCRELYTISLALVRLAKDDDE